MSDIEGNCKMSTEITNVYIIGSHNIDDVDYESGISGEERKNLKHIRPLEEKYHLPEALSKLGPKWNVDFRNVLDWGVPIKAEFMPKAYYFKGPVRQIADFDKMWGVALVSQKFKDVIEALEPGVHQFFSVQCFWPGKKPIEGNFYWFHICSALDSVNEEKTDLPVRRVIYSTSYEMDVTLPWDITPDNKLVFDTSKIGNSHIWQDRFLVIGPWCSSVFREACSAAGITGISMGDTNRYEAV